MHAESMLNLTPAQQQVAALGRSEKVFVQGAAGTGKTTAAVERIGHLLDARVSAHEMLVVVPHPLLGVPYRAYDTDERVYAGAGLQVLTYSSIIRRAVDLFWPVVNEAVGHQVVRQAPVFLNFEAAVMHLSRVVDPIIDQRRLFDTVRLPRRRIYAQILDNLSKSAVVGFPADEIGYRLQSAWVGYDLQERMYEDVQTCVTAFRAYCLENGLLDFSLTVETFRNFVWPLESCKTWLMQSARHLIYDNAEEDHPAAHDLMRDLVLASESALVLFDQDASYRRLLGSDEVSALQLGAMCDDAIVMTEPVTDGDYAALIAEFGETFGYMTPDADRNDDPLRAAEVRGFRYFPDMTAAVSDEVARLVEDEGVDPEQIAILTPYLSDALRFALVNRLEARGIAVRSLRPSRPLGGEPAARAMLLLAQLAHPSWRAVVKAQDIAQALTLTISDLDPVRAYLLASTYRPNSGLATFAELSAALQTRITEDLGERYERLRTWLLSAATNAPMPLDHFFAHLYNDVLVQAGFRYHEALEAGHTAAALVRSAREYRELAEELGETLDAADYVQRALDGLVGEQWLTRPDDVLMPGGVQIAPAYTFLMTNRHVQYQFWLDIGSSGWNERMQQPLSHPFVLNRNWPDGKRWTNDDDVLINAELSYRVVAGLLRRCSKRVWLTHVEYNEQGFTQQGALLVSLQRILRRRNGTAVSVQGA